MTYDYVRNLFSKRKNDIFSFGLFYYMSRIYAYYKAKIQEFFGNY